jgi:cell division protein FtsL
VKAPTVKIAVSGMVVFAMAAAIIGIAHVARRQQVIQLGYQLSRATEALEREQEENRRLRLQKSILTNPARIEQLAESLGMTQPGPDQIRVIRVSPSGARATLDGLWPAEPAPLAPEHAGLGTLPEARASELAR